MKGMSIDMFSIEVEQLTKSYQQTKAVDNISFNVKKGEIFGMLGRNGAGKTTTMECVTGLKDFNKGSVRVAGLNPVTQRKELYGRIGVQLQETAFQNKIKVYELCKLFESFYKKPRPYKKLLENFQLEEKLDSFTGDLSGGQRQRLSIILALIPDPEIVFLDELTTGLDPQSRRSMWNYIKKLKEENRTVFITTHYMEEAEQLCDKICIIDKGKITALETVENVIDSCGMDSVVTFETSQDVGDILKKALSQDAKIEKNGLKYTMSGHGDSILGKTTNALENNKINYRNINIKKPGLEDAFIKLTGKMMEEE
jgi:ABC-2 type transport system ATP-binding protein